MRNFALVLCGVLAGSSASADLFERDPTFDHMGRSGNFHVLDVTDGLTTLTEVAVTGFSDIDDAEATVTVEVRKEGVLQAFWALERADFVFDQDLGGVGVVPGINVPVSLEVTRSEFHFVPDSGDLAPLVEEGSGASWSSQVVEVANYLIEGTLTVDGQPIPFGFDDVYICDGGRNCLLVGSRPDFVPVSSDLMLLGSNQVLSEPFALNLATVDGVTYQLRSFLNFFDVHLIPAPEPTLVELDLNGPGDGLVTLDETTGLEWLDVAVTDGLSYNDIQNGVSNSWLAEGWRHSTTLEICELFAEYVIELSPCPDLEVTVLPPGAADHLLLFIEPNSEPGGPVALNRAFDDGPISPAIGQAAIALSPADQIVVQAPNGISSDVRDETLGNWLVRTVPEPSSHMLAAVALTLTAGLAARRRREP